MNPETFFDKFGLLADTPNGVQKLRKLILQLAVQGKLVPQDSDDEPAAVLLDKIRAEKERLVKERKIRKSKPLPPVEIDEIRFEIPESWEWIRLNQIGDWGAGATPNRAKSEYYGGSIKWLKSGELNDGYVSESYEKITESALKDCSLRVNKCGDVLMAMYGATIGKVAILEVEATTNQAVCACTCFAGFYNRYLFLLLKSYRQHFSNQGAGGAQPNISRIKIINTVAPLPPLEEQRRIVTKVDQLMVLCDELEGRQQKKQEARLRLNSAALDKLLTAHEPAEFAKHWQSVCDNFDLLYENLESVGELRKAILQLAVQGKLVAQDENDEPATVLLENIKSTNNKMKKSLPKINEEDNLCELPKTWEWVRLGEIVTLEYGKNLPKSKRNQYGKYPVYGSNGIVGHHDKFLTKESAIIVGRKGSAGALNISSEPSWTTDVSYFIIPPDGMNLNFIFVLLKSLKLDKLGKGIKPGLNRNEVYELIVSVPPLQEQRRIVAKVDQLMALCDELESKLNQSQTDGAKLMEAVVAELVGA